MLSHAGIVDAALRIGLADLSVVRVAALLKVRHSALYRYFPSRDDLAGAMLDRLCEDLPWPETLTHNDWVPQLRAVFRSVRTAALQHPGMATELLIVRRTSSALLRHMAALSRDLVAIGLSTGEAQALLDTLVHCTLGSVASTTPSRSSACTGDAGETRADNADARWERQLNLIFAGSGAVSTPHDAAAARSGQVQSAGMDKESVVCQAGARHRWPGGTCAL